MTHLQELIADVVIENLDLEYYINNSDATSFNELAEYIEEQGGFNVDIIYYGSAMDYLKENDPSLNNSLEIAHEMGFTPDRLNSETLASLLASKLVREEFEEYEDEITEYYEAIQEQDNEEE